MPGLNKVKQKLPKNILDIFERQALIYEIKGERFSFRLGPLWLRKTFEKILFIFEKNKFWFLIVLKTLFASIVILIPVGIFILIRGMLPVPERVPYQEITKSLTHNTSYKTNWFYTEAPFHHNLESSFNFIDAHNSRGVSVVPVLEPDTPAGLNHFGIGYYPSDLNLIRGFLVGESSNLTVENQTNISIEANNKNKLRIQYYLFPSHSFKNYKCKIELKDENNHVLKTLTETTPDEDSLKNVTGIKKVFHELFIPNTPLGSSQIKEIIIPTQTAPQKIIAHVESMDKTKKEEKFSHDLTNDDCVFALGDFSFESISKTPLKKRGLVFILIDTLRADTAYDKKLMPNLNQFASEKGVTFLEHRAQGNMTVPSVTSLLTSRFAREIGSIAFTYAADSSLRKNFYATKTPLLPTTFQNLGYRVGGIGWLSLFSEAMEGGVDLGFHNATISENPAYEARLITEKMGAWLESYGNTPFFLYLHYNTMHGPYKPPFTNISFSEFLSKPFGLNQRKQLYNGLARYWDNEFLNIIQKLKDLGIYDDVDIVVTADHGAQFYNQPWDNLIGVEQGISGGYADKGHTLLDEEVRVPLIIHVANSSKLTGSTVTIPTAHIDLFPTLYGLVEGSSPNENWKGFNLSSAWINEEINFDDLLANRNSIYFDAHRYAGLLYWGNEFKHSPKKYIRQFDPDDVKLYLTHNPWDIHIHWYQTETFTSVDFNNHSENWLSNLPGSELRDLRSIYFKNTPSSNIIRMTAKYSGTFKAHIILTLKNKSEKTPIIDLLPEGIKVTKELNGKYYHLDFEGEVKKDESIWINLGSTTKIKEITFEKFITPIVCQNGNSIDSKYIVHLLENNVCPFFPPPKGIVEANYTAAQKPVVIQKTLSSEQVEQIEGKGAGEALQQALRDWGYAK